MIMWMTWRICFVPSLGRLLSFGLPLRDAALSPRRPSRRWVHWHGLVRAWLLRQVPLQSALLVVSYQLAPGYLPSQAQMVRSARQQHARKVPGRAWVGGLAEPGPLVATCGGACGAGGGPAAASGLIRASERLAYCCTHCGKSSLPLVMRSKTCHATASMPVGGCLKHAVTVCDLPGAGFMC